MKIDYFLLYLNTFKRQILAVTLFRTGAPYVGVKGCNLSRYFFLAKKHCFVFELITSSIDDSKLSFLMSFCLFVLFKDT